MTNQVSIVPSGVNPEFVSPDGYDLCIHCKEKTIYLAENNTPAYVAPAYRNNHVPTAGQCCPTCYADVYKLQQNPPLQGFD